MNRDAVSSGAHKLKQPVSHFHSAIISISQAQNITGIHVSLLQEIADTGSKYLGFPRPRSGDNEHRPFRLSNRFFLLRVQPVDFPGKVFFELLAKIVHESNIQERSVMDLHRYS